jgi:hypothetical protein
MVAKSVTAGCLRVADRLRLDAWLWGDAPDLRRLTLRLPPAGCEAPASALLGARG